MAAEGSLLAQLRFRKGDLNGFVQLFFDNLATLLALIGSLQLVLRGFNMSELKGLESKYPLTFGPLGNYIDEIIYQRTVPGLGITMLFGNLYYTWMGARLGKNEERDEDNFTTALPYGVNTPGAFAFLFSIIGPAAAIAGSSCSLGESRTDEEIIAYRVCWENAAEAGWKAGVASNFINGIICVILAVAGKYVLRFTPTISLLSGLAGIAFAFLGMNQLSQSLTEPIAGMIPLWLALIAYFGDVSFGPLPKSLVVAAAGIILGWADGLTTGDMVSDSVANVKAWGVDTGFRALGDWTAVSDYIGITFPIALAAASGTLMNVLSAERSGDKYGVTETMISDGVGTIVGAMFGTPFGTSVYIGFPAYKKMRAGIMYSVINGSLFFIFSIFGIFALINSLVPTVAVAPLIFFVGLLICQDAIESAPNPRYYPAFVIGLFPSLTDWGVVGGMDVDGVGGKNFYGFVSMSKSSLLLALILSSTLYLVIARDFLKATFWVLFGAVLSAFGLIHQNTATLENWADPQSFYCRTFIGVNDTCPAGYFDCGVDFSGVHSCAPLSTTKWRFMTGYLMTAVVFLVLHVLQKMGKVDPTLHDEENEESAEVNPKEMI